MRKQVRNNFHTPGNGYQNESYSYLIEYNTRQRFKAMGFNQDLNELDALTGQMMIEISCEIDNLKQKQREVEASRGGKKR